MSKKLIILIVIILIIIIAGIVFWINPPGEFCGSSTYASCQSDDDCIDGGCSGQLCQGENENFGTTCEYRDCYRNEIYRMKCGCVDGQCQWGKKILP